MKLLRLDSLLVKRKIYSSRSQAAKNLSLKAVLINGMPSSDPALLVKETDAIELPKDKAYVSRAGLKLEAANKLFKVNFKGAKVVDIGSSTGGFSDYALRHGASKVVAIELGSNQMDPILRSNPKIDLREKTDINNVKNLPFVPEIVVIDLSFISIREVLPHIISLISNKTSILALAKPQFEVGNGVKNKGIVKNQKIRRAILKDLETWFKDNNLIILNKADSAIHGLKGNIERFYLLKTY